MAEVEHMGLLASALIALIVGLVIQSFVITINVNDWWKGKPMTPVDHIATSLGISRMCAQCAVTFYIFGAILFLSSMEESHVIQIVMSQLYTFFTYVNFWLETLLSIVFSLKISNLQGRLFLYLREVIVQRTVYFIVSLVLLSALYNLINFVMAFNTVTNVGTYNATEDCVLKHSVLNFTIGTSIPVVFYSVSSVLIFSSLYSHTTRMKMNSNLTINLETYYSVMKFVSFTFIYNTIYFLGYFVSLLYYYFYCVHLPWLHVFLAFLPVLHSSYLIYRTAKLKSQVSKVLQYVINFLFERKYSETRENIEMVPQLGKSLGLVNIRV